MFIDGNNKPIYLYNLSPNKIAYFIGCTIYNAENDKRNANGK